MSSFHKSLEAIMSGVTG